MHVLCYSQYTFYDPSGIQPTEVIGGAEYTLPYCRSAIHSIMNTELTAEDAMPSAARSVWRIHNL